MLLGLFLQAFSVPAYGRILVISGCSLMLTYFLLTWFENDKSEIPKEASRTRKLINNSTFPGLLILVMGIVFRSMKWPNGLTFLLIGISISCLEMILIFNMDKKLSLRYVTVKRLIFYVSIGLVLLFRFVIESWV